MDLKLSYKKFLRNHKIELILLSIVTLLFLVLYAKFIFFKYSYVYSVSGDIGSDTFFQYVTTYSHLSDMLHGGNYDIFSLQMGLGDSFLTGIVQSINLYDFIAILFPKEYIDVGLIIATYFKVIVIALASYVYFKLIFLNKKIALSCSLLWTFCSYIVIWGQHYQFCTIMANFSIFMMLLQLWMNEKKKVWIIMIPCMSIFLLNSYYFFYMFGLFAAIYIFSYNLITNVNIKKTFILLFKLLLMALLAIMIVSVLFIPVAVSFLESARSENLGKDWVSLFEPANFKTIITIIARYLNPNLIGGGWQPAFTGSQNYYESSILFCTVLSTPAIVFTLLQKINFKKYMLFIFSLLLLIIPVFTYLFTFSNNTFRWVFMLVFITCLCVGNFIKGYINKSPLIRRSLLIGNLLIFLLLVLIMSNSMINIDFIQLVIVIVFVIAYILVFWKPDKKDFYKVLSIIICAEILCVNYSSINIRGVEKRAEYTKHYYDGTREAIHYLSSIDDSLYRVYKNYLSVFLNDSLIQDYYGTNVYYSTNSKYLWNLANAYGGTYNGYTNYVYFKEPLFQNFVGSKYVLSKDKLDTYQLISRVGDINIYRNPLALPFGYLYDTQISKDESKNSSIDNIITLSEGFTSDIQIIKNSAKGENLLQNTNILNELRNTENCVTNYKNTKLNVEGDNDDMQLYFNIKDNTNPNYIGIEIEAEKNAILQIYYDDGNGFSEEKSVVVPIKKGVNKIEENISSNSKIINLRIDPSNISQNMIIKKLEYTSINEKKFNENIVKLKSNGYVEASFKDSSYSAKIDSNIADAVLMIPITYSRFWTADVDGNKSPIYDINNGFMGIKVSKGKHFIKLTYKYPYLKIGCLFTSIGLVIYFISIYLYVKFSLKKKKN